MMLAAASPLGVEGACVSGEGAGGGGVVVEQALVEVVSVARDGAVAGGVEGLDREGVGGPAGKP